jgi:phage terminase large subunit-like protein
MGAPNVDGANAELARRSLLSFAQRVDPGYTAPKHLRILCGLLEDLEAGRITRLCVSMPPRHGKSRTASELFPAWFLGREPKREIIIANHSADLAAAFSRKAKACLENPAWPFGEVKVSDDSRSVARWHVNPGGGGCVAAGVGSQITGIGASLLCIDDAANDALSQTELDAAWDWYCTIAFPRLNSGGKVLIIQARLSPFDLVGRIAESDDAGSYTFITLPAINEPDNAYSLPANEPLWPEMFDAKALDERRFAMGLGAFESQYMQRPSTSAGGKIFRLSDFPTYEILPQPPVKAWEPLDAFYRDPLKDAWAQDDCFVKVTGVDLAGVGNSSTGGSYHAMISVLYNTIDGNIYVIDCERARNLTREALVAMVTKHLSRNNPDLTVIEEASSGGYVAGLLQRTTRYPIKMVQPKTSKEERALQVIGLAEGGKIHLPMRSTWGDMLRAEIADFPGRYTDLVDSLVWALLYCRQLAAVRREYRFYAQQLQGFSLFGR